MTFPTPEQIAEHDRRNRAMAYASELHPTPDPNASGICEEPAPPRWPTELGQAIVPGEGKP